jgi:6,7-dimethyl-8-ribityllumazine synthase
MKKMEEQNEIRLVESEENSIAIIVTKWNSEICDNLKQQAIDELHTSGVSDINIKVIVVPGAVEVVRLAKKLTSISKYNAVICFGAMINTPEKSQIISQELLKITMYRSDTS